jgi:lipid-binding SYLF domain-containing protein
MQLKKYAIISALLATVHTLPAFGQNKTDQTKQTRERVDTKTNDTKERLETAAMVLKEIRGGKDTIPEDLIRDARCAVVVPAMKKGAFFVGAKYGKGFITCRDMANSNMWSAPAAIRIEGGSFGFQWGGSETDVVMLVMNDAGERSLLSSQFTLGGAGEVAAGPVGRTAEAQTDAKLTAGILSWSRSRGAFAGIALTGATLREDKDDNEQLYGKKMTSEEVVKGHTAVPAEARDFLRALEVTAATKGTAPKSK